MGGGTWGDFIGQHSVRDILGYLEDEASILEGMTLGQAIGFIVRSVYKDLDIWWTDAGYRGFLREAYPDGEDVIRVIEQDVIRDLELRG